MGARESKGHSRSCHGAVYYLNPFTTTPTLQAQCFFINVHTHFTYTHAHHITFFLKQHIILSQIFTFTFYRHLKNLVPPVDAGLNLSTVSTTAVITVSPAGVSSVSNRKPSGSCSSFRFTVMVVISRDCWINMMGGGGGGQE